MFCVFLTYMLNGMNIIYGSQDMVKIYFIACIYGNFVNDCKDKDNKIKQSADNASFSRALI